MPQAMANAADPKQVTLQLVVFGTGTAPLSEFRMAFNVTAGWQMRVQPPDGVTLAANRERPISQVLYLMNATGAPFQLHVTVSYRFGSQPLAESAAIDRLPLPQ